MKIASKWINDTDPFYEEYSFVFISKVYLRGVRCQSLVCPQEIQFARPLLKHPHPWQPPGARYQGLNIVYEIIFTPLDLPDLQLIL